MLEAALGGNGVYKRLSLKKREDGVYVVGKRLEIWNEMSYNKLDIPILPKEHRFSWLYAEMVHRPAHLGINTQVSKIRTRFWIVSVGRIVKSIQSKCVTCRKRDRQLASQIMSSLPPSTFVHFSHLVTINQSIKIDNVNESSSRSTVHQFEHSLNILVNPFHLVE